MAYAYYNGEFCKMEDLRIPASDRALTFGDSVYDVAIGHGDNIYLLDEHIDRILRNAKRLGMPDLPSHSELEELIRLTVKGSGIIDVSVYFQLSRDLEFRSHSAKKCKKTNILITVDFIELYNIPENVSLISRDDVRYLLCDIKTTNLLPAVIASSEADLSNCDECVFLRGDVVTECAHSNIAIIKDGVLLTHPLSPHILPGITRGRLLSLASELGVPYRERAFTESELLSADEVMITSTTKLVRRVLRIDGAVVGGRDGRLFHLLSDALRDDFYRFLMAEENS